MTVAGDLGGPARVTPSRRPLPEEPTDAAGPRLRATGLRKSYRSFHLSDVDLDVRAGRIQGFFGPNGSGKTTTLSILAGLVTPDGGSVVQLPGPRPSGREPMAVLLESFGYNPFLTGREHLRTVARRFGRPASRVTEVLEEAGIAPEIGRAHV